MTTLVYNAPNYVDTVTGNTFVPSAPFSSSLLPSSVTTKVMLAGDSITFGLNCESHGGFRMFLGNKLADAGFDFSFVGWNTAPPNLPYLTNYAHKGSGHCSYGGWTMKSLMNQAANNAPGVGNTPGTSIGDWITQYTPDVLVLMIGTNDTGSSATWAADMQALTDMIYVAKSDIKIIWCPIIYQNNYAYGACDSLNAAWRTQWNSRRTAGKTVIEAATHTAVGITPKNFSDLIHPSTYGHERIASAIFEAFVSN